MEAEFPTFTQSLLQMVYPHYLAPTPSMAIVKIAPDPAGTPPAGIIFRPGRTCAACSAPKTRRTACSAPGHAVHLMPLDVSEAEYIGAQAGVAALNLPDPGNAKAAIRLRSKTTGNAPIAKLGLERLSFYLGGPDGPRMRLTNSSRRR